VTVPTFAERQQAWSSPPVDDIGYLSSDHLLSWTDDALLDLVYQMEDNRYDGYRNYRGNWRRVLGLDNTFDSYVLDFGCGVGLEAVQYVKSGNEVAVADISESNVALAQRICALHGFNPTGYILSERAPAVSWGYKPFDVIHCAGVLHHIPDPELTVAAMHESLRSGGELRLMVYSDKAWRIAVGTDPPDGKVEDDPMFGMFWQHWDPIGGYADWYDRGRLEERFGEWFRVERCEPLTEHGEYLGAVLVKR
jgi:SAM-dependent methyltransferase